ncbi:MAG: bifunctional (p)ppGpp synthetase/guanosine-3',5'-bis(diphosphate) 3'-pyrophosphohydrolase [Ruminococcaceae bacterium]|nr:bifunctional (p)ppGpp synthetase/guanosine-3',5'-bis(diphosphate) 3'-pyrophosphohydrolase [Oscillospiraceae bacterium]
MYSDIEKLIGLLEKTNKHYDIEKIKKAYLKAKELHDGQFRASGEPFVSHPIAVAEIVAKLELDTSSICAALLHDTVEDCGCDLRDIEREFGAETAMLVDGLTKLVRIPFEDKEEEHMENLRKMFLAMSRDIRVIFIKLCDRLHNMRTLSAKPPKKQRITALETMYVYAPLAHRLGMQKINHELENLSLAYLDPIGYDEIKNTIQEKYGQNKDFLDRARNYISEKLTENGIKFTLDGRIKSVYSTYKKMFEQNKQFDEIYDFYALRVIVDTELECYTVLGIIHDMFKSVPGRFKDYISTPKPNLYRSLHTTVIGRDGVPFEVQIRTWDMHHIAEYGLAAHWKYKTGEKSNKDEIDEKLNWIAKIIESQDYSGDSDEFMDMLKIDIFHDETFVFTPKGDVITLPYGSTVIDFAYAIHSAVGNKMVGAKINGAIVPIDRVPKNGEIVEILTSSGAKGPSRDWLNIVKTSEARTKIRQWFKKERKAENITVGKAEIEKEFRKYERYYTDEQRDEILTNVSSRLGVQSLDDFYNVLGYGGLSLSKISAKLKDEFDRVVKVEENADTKFDLTKIKTTQKVSKNTGGVIVDGVEDCQVKFAKCCNPLPGDSIIGFITKGYGISIHKRDCPNVETNIIKEEYNDRWVSAYWDLPSMTQGGGLFEAVIKIFATNSMTLLADITMILADMKVTLMQINTQAKPNDEIIINMVVGCKNLDHYNSIVSRLRAVKNVNDIVRGYT